MRIGIYAILDVTADILIGGLHLHKAEAAAIRMFSDIAATPNTMVGLHPQEYDLLFLGTIGDERQIESSCPPITVITGKQWLAVNGPIIGEKHAST